MRNSTRNKLRKLEELAIARLVGEKCAFCKEPLIETPHPATGYRAFISGTCKKQLMGITVHHREDPKIRDHFTAACRARHDNRKETFTFAHATCHRSHHASQSLHGE